MATHYIHMEGTVMVAEGDPTEIAKRISELVPGLRVTVKRYNAGDGGSMTKIATFFRYPAGKGTKV